MSRETVLEENVGRVRVLTMNRPRAKNAFNEQLYLEFSDALKGAAEDTSVRVVVITGAGDAFTAGQDLTEMGGLHETEGVVGFEVLLETLRTYPKPLVTAVNGIGLGFGLTMLLHTDINFIAESARLKCPFVTLAVVPEAASSYLLPRVMGYQRAAEFLFTARWMDAAEAVEVGIALARVPDAEVRERAMAVATKIAAQPPAAVRETKRLMKCWRDQDVADALGREADEFRHRMVSAEFREAMAAFAEKRAPRFD